MLAELAVFFKMLSEPVRLRILSSICTEGEATVGELVERLQIQQSVASKHLKLLFESGFVGKKPDKGRTLYFLPDDTLCDLCGLAAEKIMSRATYYRELLDGGAARSEGAEGV